MFCRRFCRFVCFSFLFYFVRCPCNVFDMIDSVILISTLLLTYLLTDDLVVSWTASNWNKPCNQIGHKLEQWAGKTKHHNLWNRYCVFISSVCHCYYCQHITCTGSVSGPLASAVCALFLSDAWYCRSSSSSVSSSVLYSEIISHSIHHNITE